MSRAKTQRRREESVIGSLRVLASLRENYLSGLSGTSLIPLRPLLILLAEHLHDKRRRQCVHRSDAQHHEVAGRRADVRFQVAERLLFGGQRVDINGYAHVESLRAFTKYA